MLEPFKLSFISLNFSLIFFFLCYFVGELSFPLLGELIKIFFQFTNSSFQSNVHLSNECFEKNFNGYISFSRLLIDWFSYLQIVASILFLLPFLLLFSWMTSLIIFILKFFCVVLLFEFHLVKIHLYIVDFVGKLSQRCVSSFADLLCYLWVDSLHTSSAIRLIPSFLGVFSCIHQAPEDL